MNDIADDDHSRVVNHVLAPPVGTFELDLVHTFVAFRAQHLVVGGVRGRFEDVQGTVVVDEDLTHSRVAVSIATASITRNDFGLTFGLVKEAGGLPVGKDIAIEIDAEAIRPG